MESAPRRLAAGLAAASWGLILLGGLVTSTHSGLAVPDWPLSYGRLMPPMVGGILFEHGHRLAAAFVGFLTIVVAVIFQWKEPRPWVRRAAWAALALVVLQGVLGGITVLFRLPKPVSIAHGCLAQTFFCLTLALAAWTSPLWKRVAPMEPGGEGLASLRGMSAGLFAAAYVQLVLGAVLRHTGWGLPLHVAGAFAAAAFVFGIFGRVWLAPRAPGVLRFLAGALMAALVVQASLGLTAYVLLSRSAASAALTAAAATAHVGVGALFLGLSALTALWAWKLTPPGARAPRPSAKWRDYFTLTKPGISFMTGVTALAGFVLGSRGELDFTRLFHTVTGTFLVSAGACALNMLLEIDVDARMRRTEGRPLPAGRLKPGEALLFGSLLAAGGLVYLAGWVNLLTAFLAGVTLSLYLYLYTPLKKISALCTLVGAVAGALPPVLGWTAAAGSPGAGAWALFAILFFWQFPHFFALAWMYKDDYARAGLSMLPAADGQRTGAKILLNSLALLSASLVPALLGLAGDVYSAAALVLGAGLLAAGWLFFRDPSLLRARRLFFASILYIPLLIAFLVFDGGPRF
ncbi:MAG: heme o synthase [Elusimicrobiota bacterium]